MGTGTFIFLRKFRATKRHPIMGIIGAYCSRTYVRQLHRTYSGRKILVEFLVILVTLWMYTGLNP